MLPYCHVIARSFHNLCLLSSGCDNVLSSVSKSEWEAQAASCVSSPGDPLSKSQTPYPSPDMGNSQPPVGARLQSSADVNMTLRPQLSGDKASQTF